MTGTEIYKRTPAYDREAVSIRLHAPLWKLLLAFDGQRSLSEVALSAGIPFAEALPTTDLFLDRGWIEEQPITLDQYLKRTGAASISDIGAAVPPPIVLHGPQSDAVSPASANGEPLSAPPPLPAFSSGPGMETSAVVPAGPLRLSAVVDYIVEQSNSSSLGQITVYRVFLRVPPQLLQTEDIVSVHLVNDPTLVKTTPLKQAIADAVQTVLKRPLPETAYAAA